MAQKQSESEISLRTAGEELGKLLIKLYNVRIFPRAGKIFADKLFETGIEAGSLVTGIPRLTEREAKIRTANQAVLKLNEVIYVCGVMADAGFYKAGEVKPVQEYAEKILLGLEDLLNAVPVQPRRIRVTPSAVYGMTNVVPHRTDDKRIPETVKAEVEPAAAEVKPERSDVKEPVPAPIEEIAPAPAVAADPVPEKEEEKAVEEVAPAPAPEAADTSAPAKPKKKRGKKAEEQAKPAQDDGLNDGLNDGASDSLGDGLDDFA